MTVDVDPFQEILSIEEAELLSCAFGHSYKTDPYVTLPDSYFTEEEWERAVRAQHSSLGSTAFDGPSA